MKTPGGRGHPHRPRALPAPKAPRRRGRWWLLLALLLLGWLVFRLYPELSAPQMATVPVRHGTLELTLATEAMVVRREEVHPAPAAGHILPGAPAGRHVRVGTSVAEVRPADGAAVPILARAPGAVNYQVDGLEGALAPAVLPWLHGHTLEGPAAGWLASLTPAVQTAANAATGTAGAGERVVAAGEPVYKVVDPAQVWLVLEGPEDTVLGVRTGERYRVQFPGLGRETTFVVRYLSAPSDRRRLLSLEADGPFPEEILLPRRLSVRMVVDRWTGLVVPLAALATVDGRPGVLLQDPYGAGRRHVPVNVVGRTAEGAVITGAIQENDLILVPLMP